MMSKNLYNDIANEMICLLKEKGFEEVIIQCLTFEEYSERYIKAKETVIACLNLHCSEKEIVNAFDAPNFKYKWNEEIQQLQIYVELGDVPGEQISKWEYNEIMLRILADYQKIIYYVDTYQECVAETDYRFTYFWYHHMSIGIVEQQRISNIIRNHDFEEFIKVYAKWNNNENNWVYFPGFFHDEDDNEYCVLKKEDFDKITYNECECG